jgi:RES domain-containing protein
VKVKANPRYEVFLAALKRRKRLFVKWQGVAFRAAPLEFARLSKLLDGRGSLKFGGRWSAAGTFRAVNMSLSQEAALGESGANITYYNFAASDVRPKVIVGVRLSLCRVIDLRKWKDRPNRAWLQLGGIGRGGLAENERGRARIAITGIWPRGT